MTSTVISTVRTETTHTKNILFKCESVLLRPNTQHSRDMQNGYRKANRKKVREGNTLDVREADARIISA